MVNLQSDKAALEDHVGVKIILLAMKNQSHPFSFMMEKILKAIELDLNFHTDCSRLKRMVINLI